MPKRQTNNLRWKAELLDIKTGTDGNDRRCDFSRKIFITASQDGRCQAN